MAASGEGITGGLLATKEYKGTHQSNRQVFYHDCGGGNMVE